MSTLYDNFIVLSLFFPSIKKRVRKRKNIVQKLSYCDSYHILPQLEFLDQDFVDAVHTKLNKNQIINKGITKKNI